MSGDGVDSLVCSQFLQGNSLRDFLDVEAEVDSEDGTSDEELELDTEGMWVLAQGLEISMVDIAMYRFH